MDEVEKKLLWDSLHLIIGKLGNAGEDPEVEEILMRLDVARKPKSEEEAIALHEEREGFMGNKGEGEPKGGNQE